MRRQGPKKAKNASTRHKKRLKRNERDEHVASKAKVSAKHDEASQKTVRFYLFGSLTAHLRSMAVIPCA